MSLTLSLVGVLVPAPAHAATTLSGTVTFPTGFRSGQGDISVSAFDVEEPWVLPAVRMQYVTRSAPDFTLSGMDPGRRYVLRVYDDSGQVATGYVADVRSGEVAGALSRAAVLSADTSDIAIRPLLRPAIEGRVVAPPGYAGEIVGEVEAWQSDAGGHGPDHVYAEIAADGRFRLIGLSASRYVVSVSTPDPALLGGWYSTERVGLASAEAAATDVEVGSSALVLRPRLAAAMSGRVRLPADLDPRWVEVEVVPVLPGDAPGRSYSPGARMATDGTFRVAQLDPELSYTIGWEGEGVARQYLGAEDAAVNSPAAAEPLRPRKGLVLPAARALSVEGRVVAPSADAPESWGSVDLMNEEGGRGYGSGHVATDGTFAIDDLAPGELARLTYDSGSGQGYGWYVDDDEPLAHDVRSARFVPAGTTGLVLRPVDTAISGRVELPPSLADPTTVSVSLYDRSGNRRRGTARVDASGAFTVRTTAVKGPSVIRLDDSSGTLREGYLSVHGTLVADAGAARVYPSSAGSVVVPGVLAGDITVAHVGDRESAPQLLTAVDSNGDVAARATWQWGAAEVQLRGLDAHESYRVLAEFFGVGGWYAGDGATLVASRSRAVDIAVGDRAMLGAHAEGRLEYDLGGLREAVTVDVLDAASGELVDRDRFGVGSDPVTVGVLPGEYVVGLQRAPSDVRSTTPYAASYVGPGGSAVESFDQAARFVVAPDRTAGVVIAPSACASIAGYVDIPVGHEDVELRLWGDDLPQRTWFGSDGETAFFVDGLAKGTYRAALRVGGSDEVQVDAVTVDDCRTLERVSVGSDPGLHPAVAPVLAGDAVVDAVLAVDAGAWSRTPDSVSYQWFAGPRAIEGAVGQSYRVRPTDLGVVVSVRVTARREGLRDGVQVIETDGAVRRAELGPAEVVLRGTARLGSSVSASLEGWTNARLEWQWTRDDWPIVGATSPTYVPVAGDEGHELRVIVYAAKPGYTWTSRASRALVPAATFLSLAAPTLSPAPAVGTRVVATRGRWTLAPDSIAYQWLRNGRAIVGATRAGYEPVAADRGTEVQVRITAKRAGFPTRVVLSDKRKVATGILRSNRAPRLNGLARVGSLLYSDGGVWSKGGVTRAYQWLRNGVPIKGARSARYTPTRSDVGARLQVRVVASKPGYRSATAISATSPTVR